MGKYRVTAGQNIYDAALHIYGSIEGITVLLVNNPSLSMAATLRTGQELVYSDDYLIDADVAAYYSRQGITPANGERNVYFKESKHPRLAQFMLPAPATNAGFSVSGSGNMEVDWGDNTPLQHLVLNNKPIRLNHFFDNSVSGRRDIRLYGDFKLRKADFTGLNPSVIYFLQPVYAEEITLRGCDAALDFLPMMQGLYSLDLTKAKTASLLPIVRCRDLMRLNLTDVDVLQAALDEFLIALVREHYGRRSCGVMLSEHPSGEYREPPRNENNGYIITSGMEAVWLLTHEPSWNEAGAWRFDICGEIYTYTESN